jgi:hypothetical protein
MAHPFLTDAEIAEISGLAAPQLADRLWTYREQFDSAGESLGHQLVVSNVPCSHKFTPNYDDPKAAGLVAKTNNIFTSNVTETEFDHDIQSQDIIKVVTREGSTEWGSIRGAVQTLTGVPARLRFYSVPQLEPAVIL